MSGVFFDQFTFTSSFYILIYLLHFIDSIHFLWLFYDFAQFNPSSFLDWEDLFYYRNHFALHLCEA